MLLVANNGQKFDLFAHKKKDKMKWLSEFSYAIQLGDGESPIKSKKEKPEDKQGKECSNSEFNQSFESIQLVHTQPDIEKLSQNKSNPIQDEQIQINGNLENCPRTSKHLQLAQQQQEQIEQKILQMSPARVADKSDPQLGFIYTREMVSGQVLKRVEKINSFFGEQYHRRKLNLYLNRHKPPVLLLINAKAPEADRVKMIDLSEIRKVVKVDLSVSKDVGYYRENTKKVPNFDEENLDKKRPSSQVGRFLDKLQNKFQLGTRKKMTTKNNEMDNRAQGDDQSIQKANTGKNNGGLPTQFTFQIQTTERIYNFFTQSARETTLWIRALKLVQQMIHSNLDLQKINIFDFQKYQRKYLGAINSGCNSLQVTQQLSQISQINTQKEDKNDKQSTTKTEENKNEKELLQSEKALESKAKRSRLVQKEQEDFNQRSNEFKVESQKSSSDGPSGNNQIIKQGFVAVDQVQKEGDQQLQEKYQKSKDLQKLEIISSHLLQDENKIEQGQNQNCQLISTEVAILQDLARKRAQSTMNFRRSSRMLKKKKSVKKKNKANLNQERQRTAEDLRVEDNINSVQFNDAILQNKNQLELNQVNTCLQKPNIVYKDVLESKEETKMFQSKGQSQKSQGRIIPKSQIHILKKSSNTSSARLIRDFSNPKIITLPSPNDQKIKIPYKLTQKTLISQVTPRSAVNIRLNGSSSSPFIPKEVFQQQKSTKIIETQSPKFVEQSTQKQTKIENQEQKIEDKSDSLSSHERIDRVFKESQKMQQIQKLNLPLFHKKRLVPNEQIDLYPSLQEDKQNLKVKRVSNNYFQYDQIEREKNQHDQHLIKNPLKNKDQQNCLCDQSPIQLLTKSNDQSCKIKKMTQKVAPQKTLQDKFRPKNCYFRDNDSIEENQFENSSINFFHHKDQICKSQIFMKNDGKRNDLKAFTKIDNNQSCNQNSLSKQQQFKGGSLSRQSQLIVRKFGQNDLETESDFESRIEAQRDKNFLDKLIKMQVKRTNVIRQQQVTNDELVDRGCANSSSSFVPNQNSQESFLDQISVNHEISNYDFCDNENSQSQSLFKKGGKSQKDTKFVGYLDLKTSQLDQKLTKPVEYQRSSKLLRNDDSELQIKPTINFFHGKKDEEVIASDWDSGADEF